jgi:parallel beta-helix repeat protein
MPTTPVLICIVSLFTLAYPLFAEAQPMPDPPLMHLCQPADASWDRPLPGPQIPPPPTNKGLTDRRRLRPAPALEFKGEAAIEAEAAKPDGFVKGKGTKDDPWVIRDLDIHGVTDQWGLQVHFIKRPLIIENCRIDGTPADEYSPAPGFGISVIDSEDVVVRHCQVSRCFGIYGGGSALRRMLIEDCYVYSTSMGIMTSNGAFCVARGNYVVDSTKYGVFLYAGTNHTIDGNYVAWTGREGIGTNGKANGAKYTNNVILHTGWTAVNVEGETDDFLVEGNLVVDSHYGIILGGNRTVARKNQVFYGSQAGFWVFNCKEGLTIEDNLIVGSGSTGLDISGTCENAKVIGNRVYQSGTGINVSGKNATVENNDVMRFFFGIAVGVPGCVVRNNQVYQGRNLMMISGVTEPGTVVSGNYLHHSIGGISIKNCKGVTVSDNKLEAVGEGLPACDSSDLIIKNNQFFQLAYTGLTLSNCTNCTVEGNRLTSGVTEAMRLADGSRGNTIKGNTISDIRSEFSGGGLVIKGAKANTVTGNTFERCVVAIAWDGPDNADNVVKENQFTADGQNAVLQNGAADVEKANQVDVAPEARK